MKIIPPKSFIHEAAQNEHNYGYIVINSISQIHENKKYIQKNIWLWKFLTKKKKVQRNQKLELTPKTTVC
jgi:hypothetical protein